VPTYPITDHCDGERFFNPHGPSARAFSDLPKWWWQRFRGSVTPWPSAVPPGSPVQLPAAVAAGEVAATFIGHATYLLQFASLTVLTDPVFGSRAGPFGILGPKRVCPPALRLGELPRVDLVVLSHNHYDHLDLASLRWLARQRRPQFVAPLGLKPWLEARGVGPVVELDWWQSHWAGPEMEVTCTPAQHWSSRSPWDRCRTLWGGFWLGTPRGAVYFAGDSGWSGNFAAVQARLGSPAVSILPIGAYEPRWFMESVHMNPTEAVNAHLALGSRRSLAMHFGTFQLTDEGIDAPARDLAAALAARGVAPEAFTVPGIGETLVLPLSSS
jgi:L-ascorbate metabolism protein UlaG (beta-lactamase superfamily)